MTSYASLPNQVISAPNGVDYAYRDTGGGEGGVPLVLFQHFRGNLDNWDPALIDALAPADNADRRQESTRTRRTGSATHAAALDDPGHRSVTDQPRRAGPRISTTCGPAG